MKVVTFGELMVRLQPFNYERFVQANSLEFSFGGGEANVAVSLANYGLDAAFVTKLPAHAIGQAAVNSLRRYGVDTSMITRRRRSRWHLLQREGCFSAWFRLHLRPCQQRHPAGSALRL